MTEVRSTQDLTVKGVSLQVTDLLHLECATCGARVETPDQMDHNAALIRTAFLRERDQTKRRKGLLSGEEIRALRERFHLTQKIAAELFGGGPVAFAKYEADEVVQSQSMDRLLRLCGQAPANLVRLATLAKIDLPQKTRQAVNALRRTAQAKASDRLSEVLIGLPATNDQWGNIQPMTSYDRQDLPEQAHALIQEALAA